MENDELKKNGIKRNAIRSKQFYFGTSDFYNDKIKEIQKAYHLPSKSEAVRFAIRSCVILIKEGDSNDQDK